MNLDHFRTVGDASQSSYEATLTISIGPPAKGPADARRLGPGIDGWNEGMVVSDGDGNAKWSYTVNGLSSPDLSVTGELLVKGWRQRVRNTAAFNFLAFGWLDYLWVRSGFALFHGGAVSGPEGALLVCGHQGVFKTSILTDLARHWGMRLLADERVAVSRGNVYGITTNEVYLAYAMKHLWNETKLNERRKIQALLSHRIRGLFGRTEMGLGGPPAPLRCIVLVRRGKVRTAGIRPMGDAVDLANEIFDDVKDEASSCTSPRLVGTKTTRFVKYAILHEGAFPNGRLSEHWNKLKERLYEETRSIPAFELTVPVDYRWDELDPLLRRAWRQSSGRAGKSDGSSTPSPSRGDTS